jgi:hypothetical protein
MEVVRPGPGWEVVAARHATLDPKPRIDVHENARTTVHTRMPMVKRLRSGWSMAQVAAAQGVDPHTVRKWRARHASDGKAGK